MQSRNQPLLLIQIAILFGGTVFAWSKLIPQFVTFIPNPFLTACLYGSLGFIGALFWAIRVYQDRAVRSQQLLSKFLLCCVTFAALVVSYEAVVYYHLFGSQTALFICTPGVAPTATPCFTGMLFFIAAFCISRVIIYNEKQAMSVPSGRMVE